MDRIRNFPRQISADHQVLACVTLVLCAALMSALWVFTLERIGYEKERAINETVARNANLVQAFEAHMLRTIKGIDQWAVSLKHEFEVHGLRGNGPLFASNAAILDPVYTSFGIADAQGRNIVRSEGAQPFSVADRRFFAYHRDHPHGGLRIGEPLVSRVASGNVVIHFTRRIDHPDGSFAGVAVVAANPEYFSSFYRQIDVGRDGIVQLVGLDGIVRARRTGSVSTSGHAISGSTLFEYVPRADAGNFVSVGRSDGIARYMSYRTVEGYPLVVTVGTSVQEALADFKDRRRHYLVGATLVSFVFAALAFWLAYFWLRHQRAARRLIVSESEYRTAFEQAAIGVSHHALDGRFLQANPKLCAMLGYSEGELLGRPFADMTVPDDLEKGRALMHSLLNGERVTGELEKRYTTKDDRTLWVTVSITLIRDGNGAPRYFLAMVQDITERKLAQERLIRQAHFDNLTGLPNRALLQDRLNQSIGHARRKNCHVGVLFVDLDRFKPVNDTLGHRVGDTLLRDVSLRLRECVRGDDTVARMGGDEFVIILSELRQARDAGDVAQKVIEAMGAPFLLGSHEVFVTASVGIATFPEDGEDAETLISNADAAMLGAKKSGRDSHRFYTAALNERAMERLVMENDLRRAVDREEFVLHYQPKLDLRTETITGLEALLRWQHPANGLVPPGDFIPLLEESGLIVPAGDWVIEAACRQLRSWLDEGMCVVPVAINLSARQFLHGDICRKIEAALRRFGIEPRLLEAEITETTAMKEPGKAAAILRQLRLNGVRVAIDDFGTGYSSLGYLKHFPVDTLKLDRSFVAGLPGDTGDVAIARSVIGIAHSMELRVTAEGVETQGQRNFLAYHGCDEIQGYLISRPLPAQEGRELLRRESLHPSLASAA